MRTLKLRLRFREKERGLSVEYDRQFAGELFKIMASFRFGFTSKGLEPPRVKLSTDQLSPYHMSSSY